MLPCSSSCSLVGYIRPSGELHHVLNESICVLCSVAQLLRRCTLRCNGQSRHRPVVPHPRARRAVEKTSAVAEEISATQTRTFLWLRIRVRGGKIQKKIAGLDWTQNGSGSFALISHNQLQHDPKGVYESTRGGEQKDRGWNSMQSKQHVVGTEFDVCFFRVPRAQQQHRIDRLSML